MLCWSLRFQKLLIKRMVMRMRVPAILWLTFQWWIIAERMEFNEDTRNLVWSVTADFVIYAWNRHNIYWIYFPPGSQTYKMPYPHSELNVYSLRGLTGKANNSTFTFVQIAQNTTSDDIVLSRVTFNFTHLQLTHVFPSKSLMKPEIHELWKQNTDYQEYMFLKVDPQEKYVYLLADSFIFSYDLSTNIYRFQPTNGTFYGKSAKKFIPYAFGVTDTRAIIVAFVIFAKHIGFHMLFFVELSTLTMCYSGQRLKGVFSELSNAAEDNSHYTIPVSISHAGTLIAIGYVPDEQVTIYEIYEKESCGNSGSVSRKLNASGISSGISLTWLDDQGTLAILAKNSNFNVSSKFELRVYKNILNTSGIDYGKPDFILPNNQQNFDLSYIFDDPANHVLESDLSSLHILGQYGSLSIFRNNDIGLYIASVNAGYYGKNINYKTWPIFTLYSKPCVNGSYKNISDIGPCKICPTGTKNSGKSNLVCKPCKSSSFCPPGATNEVNLSHFPSYNQTFVYPQSPTVDDYDDLLIRNFFTIETSMHCIIRLPLFWTFVAVTISFLIWLLMLVIKMRQSTVAYNHRERLKRLLKQMDLIGEGERLVGGLATLVILTIIIYSSWFANDYLNSYPIESYNTTRQNCKNNQINTKFDNALQLLMPSISGNYPRIFEMLDQQQLTMTVYLINTGAQRQNIIVERISRVGSPDLISPEIWNFSNPHATVSFSFNVTHSDVLHVTIRGSYFIGALRLCLSGPSDVKNILSEVHNLRELDVCTLFYKDNQTIGLSTDFTVRLIKIINNTEPLRPDDNETYDGRWAPYISYVDDLSDEHYFKKDGEYLRYTSPETTFTVRFKEEVYFLENNQSPIIRRYELIFHTFIFGFLLIDIFAMMIVVYRLWLQPPLRRLLQFHNCPLEHELRSNQREALENVSSLILYTLFSTSIPLS